jgi:hypothetical protein
MIALTRRLSVTAALAGAHVRVRRAPGDGGPEASSATVAARRQAAMRVAPVSRARSLAGRLARRAQAG